MKLFLLLICIVAVYGQQNQTAPLDNEIVNGTKVWDFRDGNMHGWAPIFAGYSSADLATGFSVEFKNLPAPLGNATLPVPNVTMNISDFLVPSPDVNVTTNNGFRLAASLNSTGPLFFGLYKRVIGLEPNTPYRIIFDLTYATALPFNCSATNITSNAGDLAFIKVGASNKEPVVTKLPGQDLFDFVDIDRGNGTNSTVNLMYAGHLGSSDVNCSETNASHVFGRKLVAMTPLTNLTGNNTDNGDLIWAYDFEITSDKDGALWLLAGTDDGFTGDIDMWWIRIGAKFNTVTPTCPTPPVKPGEGIVININIGGNYTKTTVC